MDTGIFLSKSGQSLPITRVKLANDCSNLNLHMLRIFFHFARLIQRPSQGTLQPLVQHRTRSSCVSKSSRLSQTVQYLKQVGLYGFWLCMTLLCIKIGKKKEDTGLHLEAESLSKPYFSLPASNCTFSTFQTREGKNFSICAMLK